MVEQIDDASFHLYREACVLCLRAGAGKHNQSCHCPNALDCWTLFTKIRSTADKIAERKQFADSGVGLLIVQGKHVLADSVLARDADLSIFGLTRPSKGARFFSSKAATMTANAEALPTPWPDNG